MIKEELIQPGYALPPVMTMPQTYQMIFTILTGVGALWAFFYLYKESRLHKTKLPLYLFFAGGLSVIFEPVLDLLMMCTYPHEGQWQYLELWGRKIPFYEGFTYFFYFPVTIWYLFKKFNDGASNSDLWKTAGMFYLFAAAFETIPLQLGLWQYFGDHPLQVFGVPLLLMPIGPVFVFAPAYVLWLLKDHLQGAKMAAVLILLPILIAASGLSAVMPYSAGMHYAPANDLAKFIGAAGTLMASITILWLCFSTRHGRIGQSA